ncbi:MAG: hypothetical protein WBO46_10020 [Caldilineaceae bacterium]
MRLSTRLFSLLLIACLSVGVVAWTSHSTSAAPSSQDGDTPTPTDTPTATITPTPTITPTKPAVRTEITFPTSTDITFGFLRIEGTALIDNYRSYQLHIAPANSESWSWIAGGYGTVRDYALTIFDTQQLADGFYDLRLRSINVFGNYNESFVRGFEIRNTDPPTPTPEPPRDPLLTPLPTVSPLETPTPTPTPVSESFVPGGQGIYAPGNGAVLKSVQQVVGAANGRQGKRFLRYEIYLSKAGMDDWQWLYASQQQYFDSVIYRLDTSRVANGTYDLRLRIVYQDSNYDEYFVRDLTIENDPALAASGPTLRLTQPTSGSLLVGQVDIRGTLLHPRLARWELYWSPADGRPDVQRDWLLLFTGDYQVLDNLIARLDLGQVSPGRYDVRVRMVQQDGNYEDAFIRRLLVALPTPTPPPSVHR